MAECNLMAICLLSDQNGKNLVQDVATEEGWAGLSFPVTEVKDGESVTGAVKRYFQEQLGLVIDGLTISGIVHWYNEKTHERFIIFLVKAKSYSGELITDLFEKRNFWASIEEMKEIRIVKGLDIYMKIYDNDEFSEAFSVWSDEKAANLELL